MIVGIFVCEVIKNLEWFKLKTSFVNFLTLSFSSFMQQILCRLPRIFYIFSYRPYTPVHHLYDYRRPRHIPCKFQHIPLPDVWHALNLKQQNLMWCSRSLHNPCTTSQPGQDYLFCCFPVRHQNMCHTQLHTPLKFVVAPCWFVPFP